MSNPEVENVTDSSLPEVPEQPTLDYMAVRDRAMQFAGTIPGVNYTSVDDWLNAVDKVEAKLTTGVRLSSE